MEEEIKHASVAFSLAARLLPVDIRAQGGGFRADHTIFFYVYRSRKIDCRSGSLPTPAAYHCEQDENTEQDAPRYEAATHHASPVFREATTPRLVENRELLANSPYGRSSEAARNLMGT
jgi:hypothetical protein